MENEIYFDNSATTRISDAALDTFCTVSRGDFGNPSSLHARGLSAEHEVRAAKTRILAALGKPAGELIMTGSGSEANNLAITGRAEAKARFSGGHIITTAGEHASVSLPLARLRERGFTVTEVPTTGGELDMAALDASLTPDTFLITMMLVNNETGALYDLRAVSRLMAAKCPEAVLHCDATQAFLKVACAPEKLGADMMTVSSHKVEGPKGVGGLYVSARLLKNKGIAPMILGGGQENGLRAGTENVPGIAAFATAVNVGSRELAERQGAVRDVRETLIAGLESLATAGVFPLLPVNAAPHILNICVPGIKSEIMLHFLSSRGICVSSGSACSSHGRHGAHPLLAFGLDEPHADCCIRVSLSYHNTRAEATVFLNALTEGVRTLSRMR